MACADYLTWEVLGRRMYVTFQNTDHKKDVIRFQLESKDGTKEENPGENYESVIQRKSPEDLYADEETKSKKRRRDCNFSPRNSLDIE